MALHTTPMQNTTHKSPLELIAGLFAIRDEARLLWHHPPQQPPPPTKTPDWATHLLSLHPALPPSHRTMPHRAGCPCSRGTGKHAAQPKRCGLQSAERDFGLCQQLMGVAPGHQAQESVDTLDSAYKVPCIYAVSRNNSPTTETSPHRAPVSSRGTEIEATSGVALRGRQIRDVHSTPSALKTASTGSE